MPSQHPRMPATPLNLPAILIIVGLLLLALAHGIVHVKADEDYDEGIEGGEVEAGDVAEGLGSLAAWGGGVLVAGFIVFREAYPRIVRAGVKLPGTLYKSALTFHAATSVLLGLVGLYHGYMLRAHARAIEYALAGVIAFTLASGVILWFSRGNVRRLARLIHVQRALAAAILILVLIHVATIGD